MAEKSRTVRDKILTLARRVFKWFHDSKEPFDPDIMTSAMQDRLAKSNDRDRPAMKALLERDGIYQVIIKQARRWSRPRRHGDSGQLTPKEEEELEKQYELSLADIPDDEQTIIKVLDREYERGDVPTKEGGYVSLIGATPEELDEGEIIIRRQGTTMIMEADLIRQLSLLRRKHGGKSKRK